MRPKFKIRCFRHKSHHSEQLWGLQEHEIGSRIDAVIKKLGKEESVREDFPNGFHLFDDVHEMKGKDFIRSDVELTIAGR